MKKQILTTASCFLLLTFATHSQETSKLTIPSTPAFSILDFEPTAIMRPTNTRDLAGDILNSFDKDGKLMVNLGLEVSPYWLSSHPKLTRATYLRPNTAQTFLQSFSLSAATVKDSVTGNNKLGAGFRFKLINGEPVEELEIASAELKTRTTVVANINVIRSLAGTTITSRQAAIDAIVSALKGSNIDESIVESFRTDAQELSANYSDSPADLRLFLDKLLDNRVEAYADLAQKVSDLLYERKGFTLEFAGAYGHNTSTYSSDRIGFWANASYYVDPHNLFTLTSRFMNRNSDSSLTNFDIGIGFLKKTSKYNIALEGMFRWYRAEIPDFNQNNQPIFRTVKDNSYRIAVQGSYIISNEVSINLNFGKDFEDISFSRSGFFSIVGLNFSIFNKTPGQLSE